MDRTIKIESIDFSVILGQTHAAPRKFGSNAENFRNAWSFGLLIEFLNQKHDNKMSTARSQTCV
jgi:hypothetical protein